MTIFQIIQNAALKAKAIAPMGTDLPMHPPAPAPENQHPPKPVNRHERRKAFALARRQRGKK